MCFYYLAVIACIRVNYTEALNLLERGLVKNWHNVKARGLKAVILRKLGKKEGGILHITEECGTALDIPVSSIAKTKLKVIF